MHVTSEGGRPIIDMFEANLLSRPLRVVFPLNASLGGYIANRGKEHQGFALKAQKDHSSKSSNSSNKPAVPIMVSLSFKEVTYPHVLTIKPQMTFCQLRTAVWEHLQAFPIESFRENEMYITFHSGYDEILLDDDDAFLFLCQSSHPCVLLTIRTCAELLFPVCTPEANIHSNVTPYSASVSSVSTSSCSNTSRRSSCAHASQMEEGTPIAKMVDEPSPAGTAPLERADSPIGTCEEQPSATLRPVLLPGDQKQHQGAIMAMSFTSDHTTLLTSSCDGTIKLWDTQQQYTNKCTLRGHRGMVLTCDANPLENDIFASASEDASVIIWSAATRQPRHVLQKHTRRVYAVRYDHCGERLVSAGADGTIEVWSAHHGEHVHSYVPPIPTNRVKPAQIFTLTFLPSTQWTLASGNESGELYMIDLEYAKNLNVLTNPRTIDQETSLHHTTHRVQSKAIWAIEPTRYSSLILVGGNSASISMIDFRSRDAVVGSLYGDERTVFHALKQSERGSTVVHASCRDEWLLTWDIRTKLIVEKTQTPHHLGIYALARGAGSLLAAGIDGSFSVWSDMT